MNADQVHMAEQVHADSGNQETEPKVQPTKPCSRRRGFSVWILACCGGGGFLIAAALAWGYWEFGSLANTLAYLNGERLLVDPGALSLGTGRRGEERVVHFAIRNRTGKEVEILGAKSTCGCMAMAEEFPFSIANGNQRELTIHIGLTGKDSAFEKEIDFYTDDEAKPVIAVVVRGEITD